MEPTLRNALCFLIPFLVTTCATTADAQLIVAHRGASHEDSESTLAAFALAWEQNAAAVGGDFYVTQDQQVVCIHDKTTKRVAPRQTELSIAESTLKEFQQLDYGQSTMSLRRAGSLISERSP